MACVGNTLLSPYLAPGDCLVLMCVGVVTKSTEPVGAIL